MKNKVQTVHPFFSNSVRLCVFIGFFSEIQTKRTRRDGNVFFWIGPNAGFGKNGPVCAGLFSTIQPEGTAERMVFLFCDTGRADFMWDQGRNTFCWYRRSYCQMHFPRLKQVDTGSDHRLFCRDIFAIPKKHSSLPLKSRRNPLRDHG